MAQTDFPEVEKKLKSKLANLEDELRKIRTVRASAEIIEDISVDFYGSKNPVKSLGTIRSLGPQALVVEPWDKSALEPIASAITKSQSGLQAIVEGDRVRVPFPPLSSERRAELARLVSRKTEDEKIQLRQIRDDELKELKNQERAGGASKDDFFRAKKQIDDLFKDYFDKIDRLREQKEKELSSI